MENFIIKRHEETDTSSLSGLNKTLAKILCTRGLTSHRDIDTNLSGLVSPALLPDIEKASNIIADAVVNNDKILIVGDFDADGATATSVAYSALTMFGCTNVDYLLPDRKKHGYGLSPILIDDWLSSNKNPDLIITVDNGVSAHAGVDHAHKHGIKVVITDHHLPGETLPEADALVNPNLDGSEFESKAMAGCGVAFYVMSAVRMVLDDAGYFQVKPDLRPLLDLVAIGTVADVVPMDSNNRRMVAYGLKLIRANQSRPGIKALFEVSNREPSQASTSDLGFSIAPKLNAAGRLENMKTGVACLLSESRSDGIYYAQMLNEINLRRRQTEKEMISTLSDDPEINSATDMPRPDYAGDWCVYGPKFHQGVIGIVASRLKESWLRPVFVFAPNDADMIGQPGSKLKGSGRSVSGIHLRDVLALIDAEYPGVIEMFGGHAMAAGLTIKEENLQKFKDAFAAVVTELAIDIPNEVTVVSDGELPSEDMNLDFAMSLRDIVPWGTGCTEPVFDGMFHVHMANPMSAGVHAKLLISPIDEQGNVSDVQMETVWFNVDETVFSAQKVELTYRLSINHWKNVDRLQLMVDKGRVVNN